jgi:hypothetical protein
MSLGGCPTLEQIRLCDPDYDVVQPWCETNEARCKEQEDGPGDTMEGMGWAYCDADTQITELPACECQSSWWASSSDCSSGVGSTFFACPSTKAIQSCDKAYTSDDEQTWCMTTRNRCREQTVKDDGTEDMVGSTMRSTFLPLFCSRSACLCVRVCMCASPDEWRTHAPCTHLQRNDTWAYCNPATGVAERPDCACKDNWVHAENKCAANRLIIEGCPSKSVLLRCDYTAEESWCDTTFVSVSFSKQAGFLNDSCIPPPPFPHPSFCADFS